MLMVMVIHSERQMIGQVYREILSLSLSPLSNIPSANWGTGFIEVEGEGTVEDATVIYSYRVDRCYDPQSDPSCAGYIEPIPDIPEVEIYDALEDESVLGAIDTETEFKYDERW